jgi:hypothetical protein
MSMAGLGEAGIVYLEETLSPVRKSCTHLLPVGVAGEPIFRNRTPRWEKA